MVVLQFAWGGGSNNVHLPHMHYENAFCYVGTHDNETARGWWEGGSAGARDRACLRAYLGAGAAEDVPGAFLRAAMSSVARTSIVMMQDVLRLGNEARMNTPGRAEGNWAWRVTAPPSRREGGGAAAAAAAAAGGAAFWEAYAAEARELRQLAHVYDRLPKGERYEEGAAENVMGREEDD
jgi:4-alpha-glucanotransferase